MQREKKELFGFQSNPAILEVTQSSPNLLNTSFVDSF